MRAFLTQPQLPSPFSSLYFFKKESNLALPFLYVLVEKFPFKLFTPIYRKYTFTGQHIGYAEISLVYRDAKLT